jgi:hypothetical protein
VEEIGKRSDAPADTFPFNQDVGKDDSSIRLLNFQRNIRSMFFGLKPVF